jgi:hypothetical protein
LSFILGARIADVPYLVAQWRNAHPDQEIPDGHVFTQPWAGLSGQRRDQIIFYQYRTRRARRTLRGIDEQIAKAEKAIDHSKRCTGRSKAEVGRVILEWLYERISMHLGDHDDIGIVIADKPGGGPREDSRWLADTLHLTNDGTEYVTPNRIVMPIVTAASHHVPHLQLAGLIVAATTAAVAGHPHGLALGPLLLRLAHKNRQGLAGGAGIVLWPAPELTNILYWAFGEDTYAKVAMNAGWTLPWRDWPYATDANLPVCSP